MVNTYIMGYIYIYIYNNDDNFLCANILKVRAHVVSKNQGIKQSGNRITMRESLTEELKVLGI